MAVLALSGMAFAGTVVLPKVVMQTKTVDSTLVSDRSSYAQGLPIKMNFKVVNDGASATTYDFPSAQLYDVVVADAQGLELWHWSHGKFFAQLITHLKIAPGSSASFGTTWDQRDDSGKPVAPGRYFITAKLTAMQRIVVSGGAITNTNPDPTNVGTPFMGHKDRGAVVENNVTPPAVANTTITIEAAH